MRSGFLQRAARRVVSGYPKPWRDRYESELLSLLEDSPARLRDVVDLARGQVVERVRSLFEPGERPLLSTTFVSLASLGRALTLAAPPIAAGWAAHYWMGPLPRSVANFVTLASLVLMLTFVVLMARVRSSAATPGERRHHFSNRAGRVYLALAIPTAFLMSWTSTHALQSLQQLWWFFPVWEQFAARRPWQVEMARAVAQMRTARHHLKWAVMELERCEALVAAGFPAPIEKAQEVIARLVREEKDALATLHSLGYRARLTNPALRTSNDEPNLNTN